MLRWNSVAPRWTAVGGEVIGRGGEWGRLRWCVSERPSRGSCGLSWRDVWLSVLLGSRPTLARGVDVGWKVQCGWLVVPIHLWL